MPRPRSVQPTTPECDGYLKLIVPRISEASPAIAALTHRAERRRTVGC